MGTPDSNLFHLFPPKGSGPSHINSTSIHLATHRRAFIHKSSSTVYHQPCPPHHHLHAAALSGSSLHVANYHRLPDWITSLCIQIICSLDLHHHLRFQSHCLTLTYYIIPMMTPHQTTP